MFFRLEPMVLDSRRMKRVARFGFLGPGLSALPVELLDPGLEYLSPYLSSLSYSPVASVISEGERAPLNWGAAWRGGLLASTDERRLLMLRRRGKMEFWWVDGGREPDLEDGVAIAGEARLPVFWGNRRLRLSVEGERDPSRESRRSLM